MIPNILILRNFMCYRNADEPQELNLDGVAIACLSGDNGAGKSALLDAITWALWGRARMSDDELVALGASEMEVELRFALDRQEYKVLRKYQRGSGKKAGKSVLELQLRNGVGWKSLSELQLRQTQANIDGLLRMRYETFINSAFLLQGRADEFTRKPAGERKQVLADILDLDEYARLEDKAKERVKALDGQLKVLDGAIAQLRIDSDKLPVYLSARDGAEKRAADLAAARERADVTLREAEGRVREAEQKRSARNERAEQLQQLQQELAAQQGRMATLAAEIAAAEATLGRAAEIAQGVAELRGARDEQARLDALRGEYDRLEERRRDLKEEMRDARRTLETALRDAQRELESLAQQQAQRDTTARAIMDAQAKLAALAPLADRRAQLEAERHALDERIERQSALLLRHKELVARIAKREDSLVATREEQKRLLKRLDKQLADQPRWLTELAGAREQERLLAGDEEQLATLRADEERTSKQAIEGRAQCQSIKAQADGLKERQKLLAPGSAACPVCGSELGLEGAEQVRVHYDVELKQLRADYSDCRKRADTTDSTHATIRAQIAALEGQIDIRRRAAATIDPLEEQLKQAASWQAERAACQADLDSILPQIERKQFDPEAQSELRALDAELAELGADSAPLQRQRKDLAAQSEALRQQLDEQGRIAGTLQSQQQMLATLDAALVALPAATARAAGLEADLNNNNYAHDVRATGRAVETELRALGYTPAAHEAARQQARELAHWDDEGRQLDLARDKIDLQRRNHADLAASAGIAAALIAARQAEVAALDAALLALRGAEAERVNAQRQLEETQRALRVAERDLGEREADLRRAEDALADLKKREHERNEVQEQQALYAELREAYGKKGIQAMLIETAIPEIEREANALLGGMTDNQMHVAIKTQELTKSGNVAETLEIEVGDSLGTRVYDAFSGGEAFRVNFAIRIALSKLLARRAGARLETLVIDEGFGALDAQGRERMVEAITSVQHDFRRILVITHLQELKDLFPTQIEIVKTPQGSVWNVI